MNKDLVTICRLLGKLGSSSDAERLAAISLANKLLKGLDLSWFDVAGIDEKGNAIRANAAKTPENGKFTEEEARAIYSTGFEAGHQEGLERADFFGKKKVTPHDQLNTSLMLRFVQFSDNQKYLTIMDRELINTFDAWSVRKPSPMQYKELVLLYSRIKQAVRFANKKQATTRKNKKPTRKNQDLAIRRM